MMNDTVPMLTVDEYQIIVNRLLHGNNYCYLSGGITNVPDFYEKFRKAESEVIKLGITPLNPSFWGSQLEKYCSVHLPEYTINYSDYMRFCIWLMVTYCNKIYVLSNWESSPGAILEMDIAKVLRFDPIIYQ